MESHFGEPILFLIYKRPDRASKVFEVIRAMKPTRLFIAADGPKPNLPKEQKLCDETRNRVLEAIDWQCSLHTFFRDKNVGCKEAVSGAIDWFFDHVDQGIIIEDDVLADPSFFHFASVLLNRYRNDHRIFQIGGCNYNIDIGDYEYSYFYSRYVNIWGWGTWKRAWSFYRTIDAEWALSCLDEEIINKIEVEKRKQIFQLTIDGKIDSWGYLWSLTVLSQHGLTIVPRHNLIRNIGFHSAGSRTVDPDHPEASLRMETFQEPFNHPTHTIQIPAYNEAVRSKIVVESSRLRRIVSNIFPF